MTLREKIKGRAEPLMKYYKELFDETNVFQKQVMLYCEQQDTLDKKISDLSKHTKEMFDKKEISELDLVPRLAQLDKICDLKGKADLLQMLLIGHSKPLINEIFNYQATFREELMKLDPNLITDEEAENILAGLDKNMEKLTSNLDTIKQRLTNCQNVYNEMKVLYGSNFN